MASGKHERKRVSCRPDRLSACGPKQVRSSKYPLKGTCLLMSARHHRSTPLLACCEGGMLRNRSVTYTLFTQHNKHLHPRCLPPMSSPRYTAVLAPHHTLWGRTVFPPPTISPHHHTIIEALRAAEFKKTTLTTIVAQEEEQSSATNVQYNIPRVLSPLPPRPQSQAALPVQGGTMADRQSTNDPASKTKRQQLF